MDWKWLVSIEPSGTLTEHHLRILAEHQCSGIVLHAGVGVTQSRQFEQQASMLNHHGIPFGIYHEVDTENAPSAQAAKTLEWIDLYKPRFVTAGMFQYWMSSKEFHHVNVKKLPGIVRHFNHDQLYEHYRTYVHGLIKGRPKDVPLIVDSPKWFIQGYCIKMSLLIRELCDGYWHWDDQRYLCDWDGFWPWIQKQRPLPMELARGLSNWKLWRLGTHPVPALPSSYSVSILSAEDAVFLLRSNGMPQPIENHDCGVLQLKITADELNVRSSPKQTESETGLLTAGDVITPVDITGKEVWVKISDGQWAMIQKGRERYMEVL